MKKYKALTNMVSRDGTKRYAIGDLIALTDTDAAIQIQKGNVEAIKNAPELPTTPPHTSVAYDIETIQALEDTGVDAQGAPVTAKVRTKANNTRTSAVE